MGKVLRRLANLAIAAGWLWVFSSLGWISFTVDKPLWQILIVTAAIAWVIEVILDWLYEAFIFATCLIGCVMFPVFLFAQGWIILLGVSHLTNWYTINYKFFWIGFLMSIAFSWLRFHASSVVKIVKNTPGNNSDEELYDESDE